MSERVMVVEDEEILRRNLVRFLTQEGHDVRGFGSAEDALASDFRPDVAVCDLRLPGKDGLSLASELVARDPDVIVLAMTAYGTLESVLDAMHVGVHDYFVKPVLLRDVARKVAWVCEHRRLVRENAQLRQRLSALEDRTEMPIARSKAMIDLLSFVRRVALTNGTVLIEGESGSGKEEIARAIHAASERAKGPFLAINMAAIAPNLVESQLFGHERGAFTGAEGAREGLFRAAAKGTLFLDEIGEMPLSDQAKLLRAIESREVYPVGSDRPVKVECRLLAATNANLQKLVAEGKFRRDLYYRLNALSILVPPLRDRADDVPPLAKHFLEKHAREHRRAILGFDGPAMRRLVGYGWPGNVRELSNVVERAVVTCAGDTITVADLPPEIAGLPILDEPGAPPEGSYHDAMIGFERTVVARALEQAKGDRREAARRLGLSLATLYRRLEKLGLRDFEGASDPPSSHPSAHPERGAPS